ncbi:A disintegrin and metallopeptidase domain 3-like [Cervus canadensis]|uniref:A disintegrin and metallopeptidase domain 3-like n=1 Tax=Cervus canadensis TaxID=1574408 RepID=UPI001CA36642|nr:A disintegrin and metallopeptidase domain 3-like [Cervus canadensis]
MLPLLLILTGLGRLASAGHHSETSLLQITVPRKTERNTKDGSISETHVTYSIQIAKKTYTLPLEKQHWQLPCIPGAARGPEIQAAAPLPHLVLTGAEPSPPGQPREHTAMDNPHLLDRGILCRKSIDPCDFPEFCNGMSEFCVPDMKAADLQTCNNKSSYCFGGVCQDRTKQCEDLFGKFAKESTYQCTQEVNFQQDKFGNCNGRSCTFSQVLCGKLVCHWTHSLIVPRDDMDIQYTYLGGHICMSADIRGHVYPDPTIIKNGTMCDENKFCDRGTCQDLYQYSQYTICNPRVKCNGHGVCNSRLNCHCDAGYVPPDCVPTSSSPGGSMDDGFWNIGSRKAKITDLIKRRGVSQKNNLMISVYIFLPFFILTAIIALKWNKMKIFWNKEGTISGESPSEIGSSNSSQSYRSPSEIGSSNSSQSYSSD